MAKKMQKSSKIGLKNTHIAIYNPETYEYEAPIHLSTIKEMAVSINMAESKEYNDDGLFEVLDTLDNFEIELTYTDLTPEEQALLLGWTSVGAVKLSGSNDNPPWIAFMGERMKKDGTKRYFKYFKGKARLESEDAATRGDSVEAQPDVLKIVFGTLPDDYPVAEYQNIAKAIVDEADPQYAQEGDSWYEEVIEGQTAGKTQG